MMATTFDTYRIVKRLKEAGFSDTQAETVTDVLSETRNQDSSQLATKSDLSHLATTAALAETKADILKWVIGAIGLQTVVIMGAVITLARAL